QTFVLLRQTATEGNVTKKLKALFKEKSRDGETNIYLTPLKDIHFDTALGDSIIPAADKKVVLIFALLGALLLFIACINYVNLSTARASLRTKEVGIKKIIGAGREVLFKQFMVESLLTGLIAMLFSIVIVQLSLPYFNSFTEKHFV